MTKLPKPKQWVFSRETRLESGEHQIDGRDAEGFPVRLRTEEGLPSGMHVFTDANEPKGDDQ